MPATYLRTSWSTISASLGGCIPVPAHAQADCRPKPNPNLAQLRPPEDRQMLLLQLWLMPRSEPGAVTVRFYLDGRAFPIARPKNKARVFFAPLLR